MNRGRIDHIADPDLHLHYGDLNDGVSLVNLVREVEPHEVYNLGAQSHVKVSIEMPEYTASTDGIGALRLLEAIRSAGIDARYYQASTSEMFGSSSPPQSELTAFSPRSPYGVAKLYAHHVTVNYREAYDVFAVSGILFNHESPRRGESFVTRKISLGVAAIKLGVRDSLQLGNLEATRDWGYAPEYVEGMWRMLQHDVPDDYVLATGQGRTVRDFCEAAFSHAGLDWQEHVTYDEQYERPAEVDALIGDASKAREVLGWKAETNADRLAQIMVDADLEQMSRLLRS
jgi:GDPmannose 4,6-dehydratase